MSTIKPLLMKHRTNGVGEQPLAIRVINNRKPSYILFGFRLIPKDWDDIKNVVKKSHPNSTRLNNFIAQKISEVQGYILDQESKNESLNLDLLKSKVTQRPSKKNGFKKISLDYLMELEAMEMFTRLGPDKSRINHFLDFVNGDILFEKITLAKLEKFKVYLKTKHKHSDRTVFNHMVLLRTLFNRAIKYDVVDAKYYPFGPNGYPMKRPQAEKIGLEAEEIKQIEKYECNENTMAFHAKNAFLTSFYLAGARISDVLSIKWTDIKGERLYYTMLKNKKVVSIKISDKLAIIFKKYLKKKNPTDVYVFPDLNKADIDDKKDIHRKIGTATKNYNKWLQRISDDLKLNKKLSCHIARHSFGNISGDKIPIQMLQKLYRHSDIQTTINYQASFMNKDTDDALDKVLDL